MRSFPLYLLVLAVAIAVSHGIFYFPQMPRVMAVHFGGGGAPDGFSYRESYFTISAVVLAGSVLIFAGLPVLLKQFRIKRINVPKREYWISPENIDDFYSYFIGKMAWFGVVHVFFGIFVNHLVFMANSEPGRKLDSSSFLILLVGYFAFVIIWLFTLFRFLNSPNRG